MPFLQLHDPLAHPIIVNCSVTKNELIVDLNYDAHSNKLLISSRRSIYIVDMETYEEVSTFHNVMQLRTTISWYVKTSCCMCACMCMPVLYFL